VGNGRAGNVFSPVRIKGARRKERLPDTRLGQGKRSKYRCWKRKLLEGGKTPTVDWALRRLGEVLVKKKLKCLGRASSRRFQKPRKKKKKQERKNNQFGQNLGWKGNFEKGHYERGIWGTAKKALPGLGEGRRFFKRRQQTERMSSKSERSWP